MSKPRLVKTNAMRILDSLQIPYSTEEYQLSEEEHVDAEEVARLIGADPDRVFKTLVTQDDDSNTFVFCIPSTAQLDLKKAAREVSVKKLELVSLSALLPLTGYIRGGCSPIGMKKDYPTFIEECALLYERVFINAGRKGLQLLISPEDLLLATNAKYADLV